MRLRAVPEVAPRAVAYIRVSQEGGRGDDLLSPEIQLTAIKDYCHRRGYQLTTILEDIDRTGRIWKRRKIEQAVAMIESGDAEIVVVWKVSRVSRNRMDWAIAVDRVEGAGGRVESATEQLDTTTSTGRFTRGMLAELAAFESERIGETWKEAHRQRTAKGLPHNGVQRLGYIYTRQNGYQIDADTAPVVSELYTRYTCGAGVDSLAQWLTASGVTVPKSGRKWTLFGVRYFLDSGFAAGFIRVHGDYLPGAHTPILSGAEWEAYRAARAGRTRVNRMRVPAKLRGLVICDGCGGLMQQQGPANKRAYVCRTNKASPGKCATRGWARKEALEELVRDWLPSVAELVDEQLAALPSPAVDRRERERLARQISTLDQALSRLTVEYARGVVPEGAYAAASQELAAEKSAAVAELDALPSAESLAAVAVSARSILSIWDSGDANMINSALKHLLTVRVARGVGGRVVAAWLVSE